MFTRVPAVQPPPTTVAPGPQPTAPTSSLDSSLAPQPRGMTPQRDQPRPPAAPAPRSADFRLPPVWSPGERNRTGLPDRLKHNLEQASGLDLSDVRVHRNSSRPKPLGALAYTEGHDIHLGPGQERHLPHELWHVVQQKQGRVRATLSVNGTAVNDDPRLEAEATSMGRKSAQIRAISLSAQPLRSKSIRGQRVAQRLTVLQYNNNAVAANEQIDRIDHKRAGVNGAARNWVLANGEIDAVPANTVCNHGHSYDAIWNNLHAQLAGQTVQNAATTLLQRFANLNLGGAPANNANVLQNAVAGNASQANDLNSAFNYYIYKIGDYPENLFFWPDRTGGDPDAPRTVFSTNPAALPPVAQLPANWAFRNPAKADAQRLADEQARVVAGTNTLAGQGL